MMCRMVKIVSNQFNKSQDDQNIVGYVVDTEGTILNSIYENDRLVRKAQDDFKKQRKINFQKGVDFVKVFTYPIIALYQKLTPKEYSVFMTLIPFISYKDNVLRYNNKILTVKDISDYLGEDYNNFRKIISSLMKKELLGKIDLLENKRPKQGICVNPFVYTREVNIQKEIYNGFVNTEWASIVGISSEDIE